MTRAPAWLARLAVAAVALAASWPALGNSLVQDDAALIAGNAPLHSLAGWPLLLSSPFWPPPYSQYLYRPFTSLLLSLQYLLGGGAPIVFRVGSILLYVLAAVAFFGLARRLLPWGIALGVALLFAAHPVHVEAVALGVAQNELLVGLLATLLTSYYLDRRRTGDGALRSRDWALLAGGCLAAALLKESGLVLPGFFLATEVLLPAPPSGSRLRRLGAGYVLLALTGLAVILLRVLVLPGALAGTFTAEALEGLGFGGRALTMLRVVPEWSRLLLWPSHLQADYSPQELIASSGLGRPEAWGAAILLFAAAWAWLGRRRAPGVTFGILWTAVALFPVSNLLVPTGILLAERTLFLPSMGFLLALGGTGAWLVRTTPATSPGLLPRLGTALLAAGTGVLFLLGLLHSTRRFPVWRDSRSFTLAGVADAPRSYRTQEAYGYLLFEAGLRDAGLEAYARALDLSPASHLWRIRNDLARRFFKEGRPELAIEQLEQSRSLAPERQETWNYLILAHLARGSYDAAARLADSALARGGSPELFGGLRALADSAVRDKAPPGSIRIRVTTDPPPLEPRDR